MIQWNLLQDTRIKTAWYLCSYFWWLLILLPQIHLAYQLYETHQLLRRGIMLANSISDIWIFYFGPAFDRSLYTDNVVLIFLFMIIRNAQQPIGKLVKNEQMIESDVRFDVKCRIDYLKFTQYICRHH